ncbi:MAG: hypothetical protein J6U89_00125 [Bacteroidaceae bacterium]|nr:hypothetical protein [Bacteroidaceae bacterium]
MGFRADIGNISKDALEYVKRSMDGCKLHLIENLSLLLGDVICGFVLFMLLFVAYLSLMVAIVFLLLPHIGLPLSIVVVALLLLLTAMIVYMLRERLFIDGIVRHLSRMFFEKNGNDEKDGE